MSISPLIEIQRLHVSFPVHLDSSFSFRHAALNVLRGNFQAERRYKSALSNISFTIKPGDRVALLGANGSGKTTLLRTLNGVYFPVQGSVLVKGRVASLLNGTLGMDFFQSGVENIYIKGLQLGMSREVMSRKVSEIIDFAELGEDIERPVRTFSSGMVARLAFGIMTSIEADIYLMDEWIGAGDARFFQKATKRIENLFGTERIVVLATHSDALAKTWCNKGLVLHSGTKYCYTNVDDAVFVKNELMHKRYPRVKVSRAYIDEALVEPKVQT